MKANKTNRFQEEANKIEQIPGEMNDGHEGHDEPINAKKPRKNRFLARLRKTWARITGFMRSCCTCIQQPRVITVEELQSPDQINMEDEEVLELSDINLVALPYSNTDEELQDSSNILLGEEDLPNPSEIIVEDSKDPLYTSADTLAVKTESVEQTHNIETENEEEEVAVTDSFVEKEIEAEYQHVLDVIHSQEDLYVQYYTSQQEILAEYHINDQITDNLHIQDCDEKDEKQQEEREESTSKQMSSSKSSSLEEETPKELYNSIKTSQSDSRPGEELSTSDICSEKLKQPGEETPSTSPLTLQSFTFCRKLGEGGYAEVFLAKDIIHEECVAIKASSKYYFKEDEQSFAERKILELSHENPFLIHGRAAFHTEKVIYYVLELAPRGDLFDFMANHLPVDTSIIQFIIAELICGTQFLHKKNILHRDLKPENILVTADGHMKITDFGLALMDVYDKTNEEPRGTLQYMAPEMVKKQEYGRAVDYFAIGVILYNLSACQYPFDDDDKTKLEHLILHHTPIYPEFLTPDTVDLLQGLLCKDPDSRLGVTGDIRKHQFFSGINWKDLEARRVEPPAIMRGDIVDLNMDETMQYVEMQGKMRSNYHKLFRDFSFVCPEWSQQYHPVNNEAI